MCLFLPWILGPLRPGIGIMGHRNHFTKGNTGGAAPASQLSEQKKPPIENGWPEDLIIPNLPSVAAVQLGQQAKDLKVEPDNRYQQAEGAIPFHVFGRTHFRSTLNHVKIKNEVEGRNSNHKQ